jgi:hypothetical protein
MSRWPSMQRNCSFLLKGRHRTLIASMSSPLLPALSRRCSRPDAADPCPYDEVVLAGGTNEHRKLHRRFEAGSCPVAKRHKAKPLAAAHSTGSRQRRTPRANTEAASLATPRSFIETQDGPVGLDYGRKPLLHSCQLGWCGG